ncbi:MAG: murein biosynthesis integral membrane protein MurJ [Proteobacteria bacterium]|nr:murein biosynthesis integral membrane protein MurJ [Pseudomonadota bacterium]
MADKTDSGVRKRTGIARASSIVGSATMLSRVFGYVRDAIIAYYLGASLSADAFFVAFRIANFLRRLVGEGALTPAFVPIFTEELNRRSREDVSKLVSKVFTLFFIILLVIMALGIYFSEELVMLLSPGFAATPEKFDLTVKLTQWMFPYMLFIGLVAMSMGILNTLRHFAAPALSPVLFNISIILCAVILAPILDVPVYAIVAGVLLGGVLQLLLQLPFLKGRGMLPMPNFNFNDPAIKKLFLLMGPATLGVGVYQLNIFVTTRFASSLAEGSVSYLYYASRLMELPLGVFAVAVSTAILPSLSENVTKGDWESFKESLSFALRIVNFLTIPAFVGLMILNAPIIEMLFKRGEFGSSAADGTAYALYFYALGLVPVAGSRVLVSVFYALKDTKTPVVIALVSFVVNLVMCFVLIGPLKHGGLALATSISAAVNFIGLIYMLRSRSGEVGIARIMNSAVKSVGASVVMGIALLIVLSQIDWQMLQVWWRAALIIGLVVLGSLLYLVSSYLLKAPEIVFIRDFISKKRAA